MTKKTVFELINELLIYAKKNLFLSENDLAYKRNRILEILGIDTLEECEFFEEVSDVEPSNLLSDFVDACVEKDLFERSEAEKYTDAVMGELSLLPSEIEKEFAERLKVDSKSATDFLYGYCVKNNYVKKAVLDKNPRYNAENGLIITINKAKPEFRDAKKAASGNSVKGGYPRCVICAENEGYAPRNKRNLRKVDLTLNGTKFFWQYSPYGYFNEHGIAVNYEHIPMHIDRETFARLMDFVDTIPQYFIGCNACLPSIGGSVLAHDHYQGGGEVLPLQKAKIAVDIGSEKYPDLEIGVIDWPGTAIRISGKNRESIIDFCDKVRTVWANYTNEELGIVAKDGDNQHSSISPTVIKKGDTYEFSIILRNNITSEEYPAGVFHAHPEFHIIKKESIGLIEAQGLFILPGRLDEQLKSIKDLIVQRKPLTEELSDFKMIFEEIKTLCNGDYSEENVDAAIKEELSSVCYRILENTAVFKDIDQTVKFMRKEVYGE
ncbi:MAG: galactose-1-phosphate uridylyltransferase [Clostridia bacterium]|nr:galactose-1-phosphate uridylyltransferase [Clostridia bacterium]